MNNHLLFVSVFNYGAIDMAKNHLKSLWMNGMTNTHSYVTDQQSVDVLTELGYPCTLVDNMQFSMEHNNFGTPDFNILSYLRYYKIRELLESGRDVWYMDVDTVVLHDLLPVYNALKNEGKSDLCFQNDLNMYCTGCMLLFASQATIQFTSICCEQKNANENDQLIVRSILMKYPNMVRHVSFNPYKFPNGLLYFGDAIVKVPNNMKHIREEYANRNEEPWFVHANWMVGKETKINAFKKFGLWFV